MSPVSRRTSSVRGALAVIGRSVTYHPETLQELRAPYGAPDWQVDARVSTYTAIAAGEFVSSAVADVTGHPPEALVIC